MAQLGCFRGFQSSFGKGKRRRLVPTQAFIMRAVQLLTPKPS